jgi:uncharacterized membrane protein YkvA (DUF1232 family)
MLLAVDTPVFWIALGGGLAGVTLSLTVTGWLILRRADDKTRDLFGRIARLPLKQKFRLMFRLARDPRIPLPVRAIPPAVVLYLAVPIDLIPDFIPVLGHLDDLLIMLVGVGLLLRFVPRCVLEDHIARLEMTQASEETAP